MSNPRIVIAGSGSIGCFVGGLLQAAGRDTCFLGRSYTQDELGRYGLHLTDFAGLDTRITPDRLEVSIDPTCLANADLVLVCVKTGASAAMANLIAQHARPGIPVISLQNGMQAVQTLRAVLPAHDLRAGMVPFNVVPGGQGRFRRTSSGRIYVQAGGATSDALAVLRDVPGLEVAETNQIEAAQWGKLLMNLSNALNALSGLRLYDQLLDRDWRRLTADQMAEALRVFKVAGITTQSSTPLPMSWAPPILRLPTPIFRRIAAQMLVIDPEARTSMAFDVAQGRVTEIDVLQGEISRLGRQHKVPTRINDRIAQAVRDVTASGRTDPRFLPQDLRP
jgi:2-dehydropantoate 2-reductase